LPEEFGSKLNNAIVQQKPGASLLTIYLGFKRNLRGIGNKHYSRFIFDGTVRTQADIVKNNRADFSKRSFTFIDYGQIDSGLAPQGKSVGAVCCIDYISDWDQLPEKEYKEKKNRVAEIFIKRLETILPGISAAIEYHEVGTPLTIKRYTLNPGGAVYGFAQVPGKPVIGLSDFPDNLHFASAWGNTGGGFSGAIYSGYLCAYKILRKRSPG